MILTEFTYEKLRSAKGKITLPVHEISILIGQNGGGKTTTLDALNLFFKIKMTIRNEDINSSLRAENPEVVFSGKFQITDEEKEFFNTFDSNLEGDYITIYKKFDLPNDDSYYFIITLGTGTKLDNLDLGKLREPYINLCVENEIEVRKNDTIAKMKEILEKKRNSLPVDTKVEKQINKNALKDYLPHFILLSSEEAPDPKKEMVKILTNTLKERVEELEIGEEVNTITSVILKTCNQKIEEANETIKKYCKDIERIDITPEYDPLRGLTLDEFNIIKQGGDKVRFEAEATGKRRQIMLGIYEWSTLQITEELNENFIIAFDEPDLHFDYIQISNLLSILKNFSNKDNVQVLMATHSIKLIDNFPPNQILHFYLNKQDITELTYITEEDYEKIGDFLKDLSFSIGFRSAFLFFERVFVIVEGKSEYNAFPILFELINEKTHFEAGISFINAENNIQGIIFAKFLRDNKKEVIIIVDKDSKKRKSFTKSGMSKLGFREGVDCFFVGKEDDSEGELEGEFTSQQWVEMLNNKFSKKNTERWDLEDIDSIRNNGKISENLMNLVWTECQEQTSKPDLAKYIAKSIKNKEELSDNLKEIIMKLNTVALED